MAGPLRGEGGGLRAWPLRKRPSFVALKINSGKNFVATKLEEGKALVAGPLKNTVFCGFPYLIIFFLHAVRGESGASSCCSPFLSLLSLFFSAFFILNKGGCTLFFRGGGGRFSLREGPESVVGCPKLLPPQKSQLKNCDCAILQTIICMLICFLLC